MTKEERGQAGRLVDEIEKGIVAGPKGIMARVSAKALRELITKTHGAESHGTKKRSRASTPAASGAPA